MIDLARSSWSMRSPVDPLPREVEQLVELANKGKLSGQLECTLGTIADLGGFVTSYALQYLTNRDPDRALECLQAASEAYWSQGLEEKVEKSEEEEPGSAWPVPSSAVYRPCEEPTCRILITQIATRLDGNGKPVYLPVTRDGRSHFETCTNPKRFSKTSKKQDATPAREKRL